VTTDRLSLVATQTAVTYQFRAAAGQFGWACCTVNDATGELLITSDWGNWSHRWSTDPRHLGAPTLTAFIGGRGSVDYLARKLQREGTAGRSWSGEATAAALRRRLCERRLEHGREQLENRLEPDDMDGYGRIPTRLLDRYTEHDGLPLFSQRYVDAPTWRDPHRREQLPYLTRETARRLWRAIGALADEVGRSSDLFYERVLQLDGFTDYVTGEPWEYGETEQTPEDRALREIMLPPLIEACRARAAAPPVAKEEGKLDQVRATVAEFRSNKSDNPIVAHTAIAAIARIIGQAEACRGSPSAPSLPPGADEWLREGERGISSEAIFSHLTGVRVLGRHWQLTPPADPDDFRRCRQLLEAVPAFRTELPRMAELGPQWAAIVGHWEELCALMDSEAPGWRDPAVTGRAPLTYARMRQIEDAATKTRKPLPACTNNTPQGFTGHWRDWHRGHGCDKDDGKPRTPEGAAEIAAGGGR
jgi:hypothetical protein